MIHDRIPVPSAGVPSTPPRPRADAPLPGTQGADTPDRRAGAQSALIAEVLAMRDEQARRFGHTAEADLKQPLFRFGSLIAQRAADVREDAQFGRAANMRIKLIKLTALALAAIERIDAEEGADG